MTVQYQGVWTLQNAAQLQSTQRWVTDPLYKNTTLLLQADDAANGAQNNTFLDSSSNNFAITRNGNTTQGSFTPFSSQPGAWSVFLDASGDYFTSTATTLGGASVSTFTIDGWIFPTTFANIIYVIGDMEPTGGSNFLSVNIETSGAVSLRWFDAATRTCTSTGTLTLNQWNYFAVRVSSNAITIHANSATAGQTGTTTLTNRTGTSNFAVGAFNNSATPNAYLSNVRVSTIARTISIPISAFVNDSDTRFLLFQSNSFINNGSTSTTLTPFGNTSVQAFSPFAPQFQWTPSVIGGSGYFDGTGDFLQTPATGQFAPTGNWTISLWFYPTALASTQDLIGNYTANTGADWTWVVNSNGSIDFYLAGASVITMSAAAGTIRLNQWHFISVSRSTNTVTAFVNGSQVATASYSQTLGSASKAQYVGSRFGSFVCTGYISDVRMVDGQVVTSVPTTPTTTTTGSVTASNTKLLLNFTNAGIFDGTMKNNLETVGNAQVSTAVVKYGSGSMYFDGTGDYLRIPTSQTNSLSSGDWTIEFWIYRVGSGNQIFYDQRSTATQVAVTIYNDGSNILQFFVNGANRITGPTFPSSIWTHVAVSKFNSSTRMFVNGVQVGSTYADTNTYVNNPIFVGAQFDGSGTLNGYIDDLRVTLGIARYTQNFIPPSVALPRQ
jgi:hypothetical protein